MTLFLRRTFLVATPLALAVVLWFHPPGGENVYEGVRGDADAWLLVHTVFLLLTPLIGIAAYLLMSGLQGRAATVSRIALIFFLVFYTAWEVTVGVGTGILVDYANGLPAAEQAVVADAIQDYNRNAIVADPSVAFVLGVLGWIVAMVAAAVAFHRSGAGWPVTYSSGSPPCSPSTHRRSVRSGSSASPPGPCSSNAPGDATQRRRPLVRLLMGCRPGRGLTACCRR